LKDHKEYADYHRALEDVKVGTQSHLLFGHGATQDAFETRDIGTTNDNVYEKLQKTQTFIDSTYYMNGREGKTLNQFQVNVRQEDIAPLFSAQSAAKQLDSLKWKDYNQFTKKFDNNCQKLGLRT